MNSEYPNLKTSFILLLCLSTFSVLACSPDCDEDNYCYLSNCHSCQPYRAYWDKEIPEWGAQVGEVDGIPAYSNKNDPQVLDDAKDDYLSPNQTGYHEVIYIGQKYQCVHFARHYWILNYGASFESIDTANKIFSLTQVKDYTSGGYRSLLSFTNGSKNRPKLGDLLIWEQSFPYFPAGHVAVIVGVDFTSSIPHVLIAEQNYDNGWDAKTYARALKVEIDIGGGVTIMNQRIIIPGKEIVKCRDYKGSLEEIILGWVRLE